MSDLTGNKIIGATLLTAFVIVGLGVVTPKFFESQPPKAPGYAVAVAAEEGPAAEVADTPPDWGTVLKTADVSAGEAKTAVCKACHIFTPGDANLIGPGLYGVVGRKPGSNPGMAYSAGMLAFGAKQPIWDYDHLYAFLAGPQKYIDGTKMTYLGVKDPQDRINIIAYLHTLGSALPIPAPKAAAAPAAGGDASGAATNSAAPAKAAA